MTVIGQKLSANWLLAAKENSSPDDCSAVIIDCDNIESEATRAGNEDQTCSNVQPDALAPVEEKEHHELSEDAFEPKGVTKSRLMSFFKKKNRGQGVISWAGV